MEVSTWEDFINLDLLGKVLAATVHLSGQRGDAVKVSFLDIFPCRNVQIDNLARK